MKNKNKINLDGQFIKINGSYYALLRMDSVNKKLAFPILDLKCKVSEVKMGQKVTV